jgi:hypothetical protein
MTTFRYDVVLRKEGAGVAPTPQPSRSVTAPEPFALDAVRALLVDHPASLAVRDVPNARLSDEIRLTELLATGRAGATVDELRAALSSSPREGIEPDDLRAIHPEYDVTIAFSTQRLDRMDVTFRHRSKTAGMTENSVVSPATEGLRDPSFYANHPTRRALTGQLVPSLRTRIKGKLPEYMMPSAFVVLDALPLTPNGKIDRGALPAPDRARHEASTKYVPPASDVEHGIAGVLQELLGVDEVGRDDNFFDLGANSLMMVQASVRLRAVLGRNVALVQMFQFPSIRSLAGVLGTDDRGEEKTAKEGQERAQTRRDAMARRREMRQGARTREGQDG